MKEAEKSVSKSVSLPESLWSVVDDHAEERDGDRSAYIRRLVTADLGSEGKLPGTALQALLEEARVTAELIGVERARTALAALRTGETVDA